MPGADDTLKKVGDAREGRLGPLPEPAPPAAEELKQKAHELERKLDPLLTPKVKVLFVGGCLGGNMVERPEAAAKQPFRFFHGLDAERKLVYVESWEWNETLGAMLMVKGELKPEADCEMKPRYPGRIIEARALPPGQPARGPHPLLRRGQ